VLALLNRAEMDPFRRCHSVKRWHGRRLITENRGARLSVVRKRRYSLCAG